jgi:hypothetical protein
MSKMDSTVEEFTHCYSCHDGTPFLDLRARAKALAENLLGL